MKLTIKRLRQMIKKELNESLGALDNQQNALMALAALVVSVIGIELAVATYKEQTVDYDELADMLKDR